METINVVTGDDWQLQFTCERCSSELRADASDLEAGEFKVSGYHFAGTAVCTRRLYVTCPVCTQLHFLNEDEVAQVPHLLNCAADANGTRSPDVS